MLRVYKCDEEATLPSYATKSSSCFDLHACLLPHVQIKARLWNNDEDTLYVNEYGMISLPPMSRALIPTGLIFDIPKNHSVRLHPRSGISFKYGISLSNCEGVIDEDYVDQVYISVVNISNRPFDIAHGDRVCQGELICDARYNIVEQKTAPQKKTTRSGGFGSTGV
jgi:dUTP pyrophosphatase